ncbi:MAG: hypothetical protein ACRD2J_10175 [Thermoanaerobaculia bacterium]
MRDQRRDWLRPALAAAAFALLFAGTFQPFYVRVFFADRQAAHAWLTELPYRKSPGLRSFLVEARRRTQPGDAIAFLVPYSRWEGGYRYALRGAKYILAGRTVHPVVGPRDVDLTENLDRANVIVAWQVPVPPGWEVTWAGEGGAVARRVR